MAQLRQTFFDEALSVQISADFLHSLRCTHGSGKKEIVHVYDLTAENNTNTYAEAEYAAEETVEDVEFDVEK